MVKYIFRVAKQNFKVPVNDCDVFRADQILKTPGRRTICMGGLFFSSDIKRLTDPNIKFVR